MSHSEIELHRPKVQSTESSERVDKKEDGILTVEQPIDTDRENDAVFGHLEGGVNYRALGFWGASALLIKTQIGVGVLSFPFTLQVLGLIPGLICFFIIAAITTWSDLAIGDFKSRHRELYGLDDIGYLLFGKIGRITFSIGVVIWLLIAGGLGVSSISVALNGISGHGACTAIFMAVSGLLTFGVSSIQTLSRLSWLGIVGATSIVIAVMTLTIAVGLQDRPDAAPATGPWDKDFLLIGKPTVAEATAALGSIVYTLCGTPAFIPVVSEMKEPRLYKRAVIVCQSTIIFLNFLVGTVVYYFCGQYVTSPAPGSAGPLLKKITYGLALPGVIMGCVVLVHFVSKYVFVRWMAGSKHLAAHTWQHWAAWLTCTASCSLIAYIIASAVPVFSVLTAMGGAFLGPFVSCQPYGALWLKDNWVAKDARSRRWWISAGWAVFVIVAGFFLQIAGTYGSIVETINAFKVGGTKPFTCADNSGSV